MGNIAEKVKEKVMGAKDKVAGSTKEGASAAKEKMTDAKDQVPGTTQERIGGTSSSTEQDRTFEEGARGTEVGRKDDPLTEYREKEPMTPAKIKEHEPRAVKREMTEHIVDPGKEVPNPEAAKERARRSGMAKGTAGAAETGSEYEQGAAGTREL
jgi:hypothetical protein